MGRRGCASAMGMIKFPSSCSSPKALCNQFIDYYICSRGVFCINHIKLRNFVVITIECSIATVDRGSIMTRIYRWSMMVYSSLQAEFMVTKYDGHIHIDKSKRKNRDRREKILKIIFKLAHLQRILDVSRIMATYVISCLMIQKRYIYLYILAEKQECWKWLIERINYHTRQKFSLDIHHIP